MEMTASTMMGGGASAACAAAAMRAKMVVFQATRAAFEQTMIRVSRAEAVVRAVLDFLSGGGGCSQPPLSSRGRLREL